MGDILSLRYSSSGGPVRVFVNGFMLINDLTGEGVGARLEPYARPGVNLIRLDAHTAPQASVTAQIVSIGGADAETVLARLSLPDPTSPGGVLQHEFEMPADTPRWAWTQFAPAPKAAESAAYDTLATLARLLRSGSDSDLLKILRLKHAEIGSAMGIGQAAMDGGLTAGLANRRTDTAFQVEVPARAQLSLEWSDDRHLARALRADGRDAILLFSDGEWQGFPVTLGYSEGAWIVIR